MSTALLRQRKRVSLSAARREGVLLLGEWKSCCVYSGRRERSLCARGGVSKSKLQF